MLDCPEYVNVVTSRFSNLSTPTSSQSGFRPQHHDTVPSLCLLLRLKYHGLFVDFVVLLEDLCVLMLHTFLMFIS